MKILLLTQLFQPEPSHLKGLSFAKKLVSLGHTVEVLTGFPNYPDGRLYAGYRQRFYMRDNLDGITVFRVPLFMDHSRSGSKRALCYFSFSVSACIPGIFLMKRPDVIYVYQGPATLAIPGIVMRLWWKVPYILDVQDLWPESVTGSGMLNLPYAEKILTRFCNITYRLAGKIIVLSKGYKQLLERRGVPESKIEVVYNWCDESTLFLESTEPARENLIQPDYFTIVYAGNFGPFQALTAVIDAAEIVAQKNPKVCFLFVGDGIDADALKLKVAAKRLSNVKFIPRQPIQQIGKILKEADALLIHLKDDPLCRIGIPQKTQAYMAAGKPVIMAVKGEATELMGREGADLVCEPDNPKEIAMTILQFADTPKEERLKIGGRNLRFYNQELSIDVGVQRLLAIMKNLTGLS